MTRELVLVHGRSQQGKDSVALKAEWIDNLRAGLRRSGLVLPIDPTSVRFPFYGDTLKDLLDAAEGEDVADVVVRGTSDDTTAQGFLREVLEDFAEKEGLSEQQAEAYATESDLVVARGIQNSKFVLGVLRYLDEHVPLTSGPALALATNDVYHYLNNDRFSRRISEGVQAAFTPGVETVVVGHSLGSVVAYSLLMSPEARDWTVREFITVGSPLGVGAISRKVGAAFPPVTPRWFNAFDPQDVVALRPLQDPWFATTPPIENKTDVVNTTPNQHGISGYLGDPVVARRIYDALTAD